MGMSSPSICGDDIEHIDHPSPLAKQTSWSKTGYQFGADLAYVEQQLATLQKHLSQVSLSKRSEDDDAPEDVELLIETRSLVRYAAFRMRRARRLRVQNGGDTVESTPTKPGNPRSKAGSLANGGPRDRPPLKFRSSSLKTDGDDDDDMHSSRVTSASEVFTQEDTLTEETAPTEVNDDLDVSRDFEQSASHTPKISMPYTEPDSALPSARRSGPTYAAQAESGAEQSQFDAMLETMEDDADNFVYQIFDTVVKGLQSSSSAVPDGISRAMRRIYDFSGSQLFQGVVLGLILYRLFLALAISSEAPHLTAAIEP